MKKNGSLQDFLLAPSWEVAPLLVGWRFETRFDAATTAVVLTEVEAYDETDAASHSFRGITPRTEAMFGPPGHLYVYRSYGIHWCVNLVTGPAGHGAAVLLRAGIPVEGEETMARRRGRRSNLTDGPGKLTQALGITGSHNQLNLMQDGMVRMTPTGESPTVIATPRIGITKAVERPWRFVAATWREGF
ncbi:MAG TPA: DNA-3-methyladenine glycosylase [Acidimicrobiia bacterium]|nr:DNA-3-methyladenine glycosylase [Acidimicrobiia bacterium]